MSARSWFEARTQGAFVSDVDTDAPEDNVLGPRDCAQPVSLCFQPSSERQCRVRSWKLRARPRTTNRACRARPGDGVLRFETSYKKVRGSALRSQRVVGWASSALDRFF